MSLVQRGDIIKNVTDTLGILPAHDPVAKHVQPMIVPTVNVENFNQDIVRSATGSGVLFTTPNDRDFFLTSYNISSATSANGSGVDYIQIIDASGTTSFLYCSFGDGTLTDSSANNAGLTFAGKGILLKRNSAITTSNASGGSGFLIVGYTRDKY